MDELNPQNISSDKPKKTRAKKPKVLPELSVEIPEQSLPVIPSPPSPDQTVAIQAPKPKRVVSEKTKLALAEGRAKLRELKEKQRQDRSLLIDTKINQKAERIAIQKMKLMKDLNLNETEDAEEEDISHIITNKSKKALETLPLPVKKQPVIKKKLPPKVIYVSDEEEEDEPEVVYKIKPKGKAPTPAPGFGGIQFY
jgi:hypothetical protein